MSSLAASFAPDSVFSGTGPAAVEPAETLVAAAEAVEELGSCSADYDALSDTDLLAGQRELARLRGLVDTRAVWLAKTVAYRSRRELGQRGLAAKQGFLTPDELIQDLTGSTRQDARRLVDVGRMLGEAEVAAAEAAAAAKVAEEAAAARAAQEDAEAARRQLEGIGGIGGTDGPDGTDWADGAVGDGGADTPTGLFEVGALFEEPVAPPWFTPITDAVNDGTLSIAAAHAIRTGLGNVDTIVTGEVLTDAVCTLISESKRMNVDQLLKRSRRMRDSLDEAGIAKREQKAWDDRYVRVWKTDAGQVHIHGQFPPEQGELVLSVYDSVTGPRRGGVRFVDPDRAAWAKAVQDDPRSTDQIAADTFIDLLKAGSEVDPNRMLGGRTPAVRIHTTVPTPNPTGRPTTKPTGTSPTGPTATGATRPTATGTTDTGTTGTTRPTGTRPTATTPTPTGPPDAAPPSIAPPDNAPTVTAPAVPPDITEPTDVLVAIPDGAGHGYIEGNPAPISRETINRLICNSGTIEVTFAPDGQPLNLGREERIFSQAQRVALAARDGGCRWGNCDRPPSRTEAHHLDEWARDHGHTDIRLGILLCPPHHQLLHAQGWQIFEHHGRYWLRPPASVDPGQTLIELHTKNPNDRAHPRWHDRHGRDWP